MKYSWQIFPVFTAAIFMAAASLGLAQAQPAPRANSAGVAVQNSSYLGVGFMDVDAARAAKLKLKEARGAEITQLDESGPAAKAGVKVGDVVMDYNGQPVQGGAQLQNMVRDTLPGHEAKLSVWRNGAVQTITTTIESRRMVMIAGQPLYAVPPAAPQARTMPPMSSSWPYFGGMPNFDLDIPRIQTVVQNSVLGIIGEPLGDEQQFAEFFGVKDGVLVKAVSSNSPAEHAGVKAGDVIVKVGDVRVGSLRELTAALRAVRSNANFTLVVIRNKKEMPVTVVAAQHGG